MILPSRSIKPILREFLQELSKRGHFKGYNLGVGIKNEERWTWEGGKRGFAHLTPPGFNADWLLFEGAHGFIQLLSASQFL